MRSAGYPLWLSEAVPGISSYGSRTAVAASNAPEPGFLTETACARRGALRENMAAERTAVPVQPGQVSVHAFVTVTLEIAP